MKFEIKHRLSGKVLFSLECESMRFCFEMAIKQKCNLSYSDLSGSDLRGSDLSGSDLRGSDLSYSDLSGSNLSYSDLSGSDLSYSDLSGSDLRGSNLRGSNLRGSNLSGSDLRGSDLSGSNLRGSNLMGSDLSGSDLSGSNLSGSDLIQHLGQPNGWHSFTYFDTENKTHRVQVGCRNFTLAEGRKYWAAKDDRREVLAALDYAQAIAKIRGWK